MFKKLQIVIFFTLILFVLSKKQKNGEKPAWARKDIRDYTDADMEMLLDQWEVRITSVTVPKLLIYVVFDRKMKSP